MPATSVAQQRAAGADLARLRAGKRPRRFSGMSEDELRHFAKTAGAGLPARAAAVKRRAAKARRKR